MHLKGEPWRVHPLIYLIIYSIIIYKKLSTITFIWNYQHIHIFEKKVLHKIKPKSTLYGIIWKMLITAMCIVFQIECIKDHTNEPQNCYFYKRLKICINFFILPFERMALESTTPDLFENSIFIYEKFYSKIWLYLNICIIWNFQHIRIVGKSSIQNIHSVQLFGRSLFPVMYILFQIECIKDFKNVPQNCMCIFITIYLNA